ncbi:MAG: hypothetical protein WAN84_06955 [Acutalibacteraceae bacterium]
MDCATSRISTIVRTYEAVLPFFVVIGSVIMQFCPTIRTENFSRKDTDFTRCSWSSFVFSDFLYRVKDILCTGQPFL